ncbi:MAG TPA: glycosyltransferase family 39 protein [Polyangia bacterium]|nr:glycosyltransferase family 39 protein [Polyangia bacterium]
MDVIFPVLLFLFIGAIAIFLCASVYKQNEERVWLTSWLWVALVLRLGAAALFATLPETRIFHEDADGYEYIGMAVARIWHGGPGVQLMPDMLQNYGYKYVVASLYYVFGQFQALPSCLNCVVGTISVFLVYHLARQFFHQLVARRAALLTALIPSMILWNAIALKESLMSLLILLALVSCVALKRRFSFWPIVGITVSVVAIQPLRYYMVYFLGFAIVVSLFLERGVRMVSGLYKQLVVVAAMAALLAIVGISGRFDEGATTLSLANVSHFRHGMAVTASSGFDADVDISTPAGALAFLPIGMANLLLGPFPWQMGSLRALLAAPETIYWWILFPSLIRGFIWSLRNRFSETSPLLLFAVTLTIAYSLMHGNIGSGFRQRGQIFIILFIFASFGLFKRRAERAGINPKLLLSDRLQEPTATPPAAAAARPAA